MSRPDIAGFEVGMLYRHDHTGGLVEFLGIATMPELDGEEVGVFRFTPAGRCLIATGQSFNGGETFTPAGEAAEELDDL